MKKLVLLVIGIVLLLGSETYKLNDYDGNLKIVYLGEANKLEKYVLKQLVYKLKNDFDDVELSFNKDKGGIYSLIDRYYYDKEKLLDGDLRKFFDKDDELVVLFSLDKDDNGYTLKGIKLFKDGDNEDAMAYEVKVKEKALDYKKLASMMMFFIKSSMYSYSHVVKKGIPPIIIDENGTLKVLEFSPIDARLFNSVVSKDDIEFAYDLGLISSNKNNAKTAKEYCHLIGMMLPNKKFIKNNDEFAWEDYFQITGVEDGYLVMAPYLPTGEKDFRCIDDKNSLNSDYLLNYEANTIGLMLKIKSSNFIKKGDFEIKHKNFLVVLASSDDVSIYKNKELLKSIFLPLENLLEDLKLEDDKIKVYDITNEYTFNPKEILLRDSITPKTSTYYDRLDEQGVFYPFVSGTSKVDVEGNIFFNGKKFKPDYDSEISAIERDYGSILVGFKDGSLIEYFSPKRFYKYNKLDSKVMNIRRWNNYWIVSDSLGNLKIFKAGKKEAVVALPVLGYAYSDIKLKGHYMLLVNLNQKAYLIDLNILLKEEK